MYRVIRLLCIITACYMLPFNGFAQDVAADSTEHVLLPPPRQLTEFDIALDSMSKLMRMAEVMPEIKKKEELTDAFRELLVKTLKKDSSFNFPLDTIPHVSTLTSDDSLVRIFTWSVPTGRLDEFLYYGIVQHRLARSSKISDVFVLDDVKDKVLLPEQEELKYPEWYGCLYYQMVQKNDGKKTYYTLIGGDFNNSITRKKYIDVLTFDRRSNPVFGAPIFLIGKKPQKRVVFEYTSQSVMLLRYFKDIDKIVFNYLYPIVEEKKDDSRYYVPDVSYEGLMFKLGKWIKIPNVELRQKN